MTDHKFSIRFAHLTNTYEMLDKVPKIGRKNSWVWTVANVFFTKTVANVSQFKLDVTRYLFNLIIDVESQFCVSSYSFVVFSQTNVVVRVIYVWG